MVEGCAPLDLHEGIDDPLGATACSRWPRGLLLKGRGPEGVKFVGGRCRATNLCSYCQTLYVVETMEMLKLDAMEYAPTLWAVLTAREHLTRAECRRHLLQLLRAARKRWPRVEWFVQVEFQRRGALHLNLLVKGVPAEDADEFRGVIARRWCARVDALPVGQAVMKVNDGAGLVRYLNKTLAHGLKREQAPPLGWRGHRTSQTKGYLVRPASEMRVEAKRSLRMKRALRRGVPGDLLEVELELEDAVEWSLIQARRIGRLLEPGRVIA